MKEKDFVWTVKYLHQYGNAVVLAIKKRIRQDKLIDTGALINSIDYNIITGDEIFGVEFVMGDGEFRKGSGLPSEYGVYQDQGTKYIDPHYFFTAPIPGLTKTIFNVKLGEAMSKDFNIWMKKDMDKFLGVQAKKVFNKK